MFAARDPVLCDAWAAELLGYHADEIPYIGLAEELGVGSKGPAKIRELNKNADAPPPPRPAGKVKQIAGLIDEKNACSACYASLVFALSRLKPSEKTFAKKICIGQGFRGKAGRIGAGLCTAGFKFTCPGCPPTGGEILKYLKSVTLPTL